MTGGRSMLKAQRLVGLRDRLADGDFTRDELMRHLGLPGEMTRTVQRDLLELQDEGTVTRLENGRYALARKGPSELNDVEALAVYSAARLLFHHAAEYNAFYASALDKLARLLPGEARATAQRVNAAYREKARVELADPAVSRRVEVTAQAWFHRRYLSFEYAAASSGRTRQVELAIYFIEINAQNRAAYAIGHERTSDHPGVRVFKIARMRRPELLPDVYDIPADFDAPRYLSNAWGIMSGEPTRVRLHFRPDVAARVREERFPRLAKPVTTLPSGWVEVELEVGGTLELAPWIKGWGSAVAVIDPPELREQIAQDLRLAAAQYA